MDRRSFIKLTAITTSSAALASCGNPENQLIRFVPAEDITPGQATWKPSVCPVCSAGCGLTVRVMDAERDVVRNGQAGVVTILAAKKLEGQPDHPVNRGGLCARGQSAIQITYHPDRITQPLKRSGERGDGRYEAISWDDATAELVNRLNGLQAGGNAGALAAIRRPGVSQRAALLDRFLIGFGAPAAATFELFGDEVVRRANAMSFGRAQKPTLDLANANYVVSFGADFLGTWNSVVSQNRAYGEMRQGRRGIRGTFVQVEPRMSQTGANADEWVPVRPGTEGVLALGLAQAILGNNLRGGAAGGRAAGQIEGGLAQYTPEQVQKVTGIDPRRLDRLARELASSPNAVAVVGGAPLAHTNGLFTALAVNALNEVLGALERPGGMFFTPGFTGRPEGRPLQELLASNPQVLLVDGANPVFTAPRAWKVRETLAKVPYVVSFGNFLDETSILADLILPDHSFLEGWVEAAPESGSLGAVVSAAGPAMRPLHDTRATGDVLLDVGRRLGTPVALPWMTYEEMIGATLGETALAAVAEKGWTELPAGGASAPSASAPPASASPAPSASPASEMQPRFDGDGDFFFLPYPSTKFGEGETAHLPWLQEMPDPMTSAMWSSWVEINERTAQRLGITMGDIVEVTSSQGSVRAPAFLSPAIAPDIVAMPVGQGHETFTRYASKRGANPAAILAPVTEPATGALAWAATKVRVARAADPDGGLILFAGSLREHHDEGR